MLKHLFDIHLRLLPVFSILFRYVTEGGGHIANVTDRYKEGEGGREGQILAKKSVTYGWMIPMNNWKITQYNLSKSVCFSFSACFVFSYLRTPSIIVLYLYLLLKHISIWLHYTNYCRKSIPCASNFKRYLSVFYRIISLSIFVLSRLRFILWSSSRPSLFNWPRVQLYLKVPNHKYVLYYLL